MFSLELSGVCGADGDGTTKHQRRSAIRRVMSLPGAFESVLAASVGFFAVALSE